MDIALFSPSSLFPDDDDSSSRTLSLNLVLQLCWFSRFIFKYKTNFSLFLSADETTQTQQSYVERSHEFPGMVYLILLFYTYIYVNCKTKLM